MSLALAVALLLVGAGTGDTLESVRFEGNRAFSNRTLLKVAASRPGQPAVEAVLDNDARLLERFYHDNGFVRARVERRVSPGKRRWVAVFTIQEGPRARVSEVVVSGNLSFEPELVMSLLPVKTGQNMAAGATAASEEAVRDLYLNAGFPFTEVTGSWSLQETLAVLSVEIVEGARCHIREVAVRGNRGVRTGTILRAAEIKPGELFRRNRLHEAQSRLYATRLFRRVLFSVVQPDSTVDSVVVRLDVAEQPYHVFSVGAGFEATPWRLLGAVGWEHANVLNRGQTFEVGTEFSPNLSGDYRLSVDATYRVPYLLLTRIDFASHPFFFVERLDTTSRREYGIETGVSRSLLPQLSVGLHNRLRLVADTSRGVTNSLALNVQYDTRNDVFDPTHGIYVRPATEFAGWMLMGDNDFLRLTAEARWFLRVGLGFVLGARAMAGQAVPFGRIERIPYYEGFTLGGRNNLRGYGDRSLGPDSATGMRFGPRVVNANVEIRSPYLLGWVGLVGFFDCGQVDDSWAGLGSVGIESSAGIGVRVRTPIGPVRLDWGRRLRNPVPGDRGKLYLGLMHAF